MGMGYRREGLFEVHLIWVPIQVWSLRETSWMGRRRQISGTTKTQTGGLWEKRSIEGGRGQGSQSVWHCD